MSDDAVKAEELGVESDGAKKGTIESDGGGEDESGKKVGIVSGVVKDTPPGEMTDTKDGVEELDDKPTATDAVAAGVADAKRDMTTADNIIKPKKSKTSEDGSVGPSLRSNTIDLGPPMEDVNIMAESIAEYLRKHFQAPLQDAFNKLTRERPEQPSKLLEAVFREQEYKAGEPTQNQDVRTLPVRHYLHSAVTPILVPVLSSVVVERPSAPVAEAGKKIAEKMK